MTGPVWPDLLTVHVTKQDIAAGEQKRCMQCPIALAARRALGLSEDDWIVSVLPSVITVYEEPDGGRAAWWRPPKSARVFIAAFDMGQDVEPFTFAAERAS